MMTQSVGAFFKDGKAVFTVWVPLLPKVELELQSGGQTRTLPMHRDDWGYWTAHVDGVQPGDRYGYRLDDSRPYPDPASRSQPDGVQALSEITSLDFGWTDAGWRGLPMNELVLYELHVGTFTAEGTFDGVIEKLDYLQELGITAIEIMPVAQFPGTRNWGYDGVFPYAVQHSYGGATGLKTLVDACHRRGIAVFLDVVYNHIGPEGNHFHHYGPYFSKKSTPVWGEPFNFDDAHCDQVRHFFIQNALMWLGEFHIDGLRLDATDHIWDSGAKHFLRELAEETEKLRQKNQRGYLLVGESDLNDPKIIRPVEQHGYGLSGQWLDNFHHAIHSLATGDRGHYYADFGELHHLHKAFGQVFVYNGTYSEYRKKTFGTTADGFPCDRFVVFSQNHDQVGNRLLSDRLSAQVSHEMLRVIAGTCILSPYVPLLFMGEEYGETNPFYYFISHGDLELIESVREGRKKEFLGFQKEGFEYLDPQSEETFRKSMPSWEYAETGRQQLREFYRELIHIRKSQPAFRNADRSGKTAWMEHGKALVWEQQAAQPGGPGVGCIANFAKSVAEVNLPAGRTYTWLLHSQSFPETPSSTGNPVSVPPECFLVYGF